MNAHTNSIKVLIELVPPTQGNISNYQINDLHHEISTASKLDVINKGGINPFYLGVSKLGAKEDGGDGLSFWGNEDEWVGDRQVGGKVAWYLSDRRADSEGFLLPEIELVIRGTGIDNFSLWFDDAGREWASILSVDGVEYGNSDALFFWQGNKANEHIIRIKKWSKPNAQVRVLSILTGLTLEYEQENIASLVIGNQNTFDNTKPFYGVAPQYGSLTLFGNNFFNKFGFKEGAPVRVYFGAPERVLGENTSAYTTRIADYKIGDLRIEKAKQEKGVNKVVIELIDKICYWENTFFDGIGKNSANTAETIFEKLNSITNNTTGESVQISAEMRQYLKSIKVPDGYISQRSLMSAWSTFCDAFLVKITKIGGDLWMMF